MTVIEAAGLGERIEALCLEVSTNFPPDAEAALAGFRDSEESDSGRRIIDLILENARVASDLGVPIFQEQVAQRAALFERGHRGLVDDVVGHLAADALAQRQHDRF